MSGNLKRHIFRLIKGQQVKKAICNKGFSGNLSIVPRSDFCIGGQESSPKSLTAYSLDRYDPM